MLGNWKVDLDGSGHDRGPFFLRRIVVSVPVCLAHIPDRLTDTGDLAPVRMHAASLYAIEYYHCYLRRVQGRRRFVRRSWLQIIQPGDGADADPRLKRDGDRSKSNHHTGRRIHRLTAHMQPQLDVPTTVLFHAWLHAPHVT
jgi:hypothetical protein